MQLELSFAPATAPGPTPPNTPAPLYRTGHTRLPEWAIGILGELRISRNRVQIPCQLPQDRYALINDVLQRLGGQWKGGRTKAHVFDYDPLPLLKDIVQTGVLPHRNPGAFFETPKSLLDDLFLLSDLESWMEYLANSTDYRILEPSAGTGSIAAYVAERYPAFRGRIDCVELDPLRAARLRQRGLGDVHETDFLTWNPTCREYGAVLMNPPFSTPDLRNAYIDHVQRAEGLLRATGTLVAILPSSVCFNTDSRIRAFRNQMVEQYDLVDNGTDAFKESGTHIATVTIHGVKGESQWKNRPRDGYPDFHTFQYFLWLDNDARESDTIQSLLKTSPGDPSPLTQRIHDHVLRTIHDTLPKHNIHISSRPETIQSITRELLERQQERSKEQDLRN